MTNQVSNRQCFGRSGTDSLNADPGAPPSKRPLGRLTEPRSRAGRWLWCGSRRGRIEEVGDCTRAANTAGLDTAQGKEKKQHPGACALGVGIGVWGVEINQPTSATTNASETIRVLLQRVFVSSLFPCSKTNPTTDRTKPNEMPSSLMGAMGANTIGRERQAAKTRDPQRDQPT